jgi:hypothetical protein
VLEIPREFLEGHVIDPGIGECEGQIEHPTTPPEWFVSFIDLRALYDDANARDVERQK